MKQELRSILVPVDFKEPSLKALRYAMYLSRKFDGELVLLHVIETPGLLADFFSKGDSLDKIKEESKNKLEELTKEVQKKDLTINVSYMVQQGKPYKKILEVALNISARMIVLGENHAANKQNEELGTTIYHVTLKSPVPVLTYKGNTEKMVEKIVVPLDLTKETRKQVFSALTYGMNYGAQIYLVSVLIGGIKVRESRIFKKLKKAKNTIEENGVECFAKLLERSDTLPYKRVLEYAEEVNAGMILVMTHQEGYTYDNYIGAFAHHIINEANVPVLSLTVSATGDNFTEVFKGIVDPVGLFSK